jgi:hypothetical protein
MEKTIRRMSRREIKRSERFSRDAARKELTPDEKQEDIEKRSAIAEGNAIKRRDAHIRNLMDKAFHPKRVTKEMKERAQQEMRDVMKTMPDAEWRAYRKMEKVDDLCYGPGGYLYCPCCKQRKSRNGNSWAVLLEPYVQMVHSKGIVLITKSRAGLHVVCARCAQRVKTMINPVLRAKYEAYIAKKREKRAQERVPHKCVECGSPIKRVYADQRVADGDNSVICRNCVRKSHSAHETVGYSRFLRTKFKRAERMPYNMHKEPTYHDLYVRVPGRQERRPEGNYRRATTQSIPWVADAADASLAPPSSAAPSARSTTAH